MLALTTIDYPRLLAGAAVFAALGLGAAAWAQDAAPAASGYVCLSNGCAAQAQVAAPPPAARRPLPTLALISPDLPIEEMKAQLMASMLSGLTDEQRATGEVVVVDNSRPDRISLEARYQGPNGARASKLIQFARPANATPSPPAR